MRSYTKHVSRGLSSNAVHISRTRKSASFSDTFSEKSYRYAKTSILVVIISAMLVMILFTLFNFIATPEFIVKRKIESIAKDYYENYFYNSIPNPSPEALNYYVDRGFASVNLRQLLLYDDQKYASATESLKKYCNLDRTFIKIYPEAPFNRKDYRVDYSYSCKF